MELLSQDHQIEKDPLKLVKKQYSDQNVIKQYLTVGLFPTEEKLIDTFFEAGSTVLDLGCGAGRTTIALAKKEYKVTGIDLSPGMIEAAKYQAKCHNVNVNYKVMNAVEMDFQNHSFQNVLFSFNGLDQIPGKKNREEVFRNIFKVLKPEGCFIFTTRSGLAFCGRRPIAWVWISIVYLYERIIKANKKWEFGDKVRHDRYVFYINPFKLKKVVKNYGFELLYFNSSVNAGRNKSATFFTNFSADRALYYVFKKISL